MAFGSESEDNGQMTEFQRTGLGLASVTADRKALVSSNSGKGNKRYPCPISECSASFSRPWRLEAHISVHCGQTPFKCEFDGCSKAYTSQNHLTRHKKTAHCGGLTPSRQYKCPHEGCNAVLKTSQNLKKHYKRAHVVNRVCPECGEHFAKTIQMKYHMQIHTGVYLHECEPCGLKFARKTEYEKHMRGHRIHLCPYGGCMVAFTTWSAVRKHLKTHKPKFICYYCKKPSIHKGNFRHHVLSHLDEPKRANNLKTYTCHHCDKGIRGKQSLRRHIKCIHLSSTRPTNKPKAPRKPRKDKGIPKLPMSSQLAGIECSQSLTNTLIGSCEPVLETAEEIIQAIEECLLL